MSPRQLVFSIQSCDPAVEAVDLRTADVAGALQAIFPMNTADAILNWNRIAVRLSYRHDVSVLIDDLLPLMLLVTSEPSGERRVEWGSDTFQAQWDVRWAANDLHIASRWTSISGDYHDVLNQRPIVSIARSVFILEWRGLLATILRGIDASGVKVERTDQLRVLRRLVAGTDGHVS